MSRLPSAMLAFAKEDLNSQRRIERYVVYLRSPSIVSTPASLRKLTICLISRHPGLLTTMESTLSRRGFTVRSLHLTYDSGYSLKQLQVPRASVFVLDISSNHLATEVLIDRIRYLYPRARFLVVKETLRDEKIFPYLRMGARGVVRYVDARRDLIRAVKAVDKGDLWLSREQLVRFVDWILTTNLRRSILSEPGPLSRRERQVLVSILQGHSNKEIAATLKVSESTVKFHVSHILQKFGAQRRADLIARQHQLWPIAS